MGLEEGRSATVTWVPSLHFYTGSVAHYKSLPSDTEYCPGRGLLPHVPVSPVNGGPCLSPASGPTLGRPALKNHVEIKTHVLYTISHRQ